VEVGEVMDSVENILAELQQLCLAVLFCGAKITRNCIFGILSQLNVIITFVLYKLQSECRGCLIANEIPLSQIYNTIAWSHDVILDTHFLTKHFSPFEKRKSSHAVVV
jgi:hypothetical protein